MPMYQLFLAGQLSEMLNTFKSQNYLVSTKESLQIGGNARGTGIHPTHHDPTKFQ